MIDLYNVDAINDTLRDIDDRAARICAQLLTVRRVLSSAIALRDTRRAKLLDDGITTRDYETLTCELHSYIDSLSLLQADISTEFLFINRRLKDIIQQLWKELS